MPETAGTSQAQSLLAGRAITRGSKVEPHQWTASTGVPALLWTATMLTNVSVILGEEAFGVHRTPHLAIVLLANAAWVLFPLLVLFRMSRERPFIERTS
jgi:hypothetical protein